MPGSLNPYTFMNPGTPVPPSTGFEGLPGAGNPLGGLMYAKLSQHMQASGYMPLGFSGQNIADQARNQRFLQMHNDLLVQASLAERENYMRTIQGGFRAAGAAFGQEEREATEKMLNAALPYTGMLAASNPDILEWMGGRRGSMAAMGQRMIMGSRFRFDPVSGQLGMGRESIGTMFDTMRSGIMQDDISHLRGFTAGQMGDMSQFLLSRGLLPGDRLSVQKAGLRGLTMDAELALGRKMDRMSIGAGSLDIDQMSPTQLREIAGDREVREQLQTDPAAVQRMRKFDSARVLRAIESYTDAASAVGELFGTPNKGIPALMAQLEQVVGPAAMAQLSPQRLATLVRQTSELSKMTSVPPEAAMAMQQHAMNQAVAMGLQGFQGIQVAQHAMGFAGALRGAGQAPAWGALSAQQATMMDIQLTASATRSRAANRLGAFARAGAAMGGFQTEEAQLLMQQIETGTLTDIPDRRRLMEILGAEGMGGAQISAFLSQRFSNQRLVEKFGIGGQVRDLQGPEARRNMARNISGKIGGRLADVAGLDAIPGISEAVISDVMAMTQEDTIDPQEVNRVIQRTLRERLGEEGFAEAFGEGEKGIKGAQLFGEEIMGRLEKRLRRDRNIAGVRTVAAARTMFDPGLREKGRQLMAAAQVRGVVTSGLEALGRGNLMQHLIGALQTSTTGDISDVLGRTLGATTDEVRETVLKSFEALQGPMKALADLERKAETETDPVKRNAIIKEAREKQEALQTAAGDIARELEVKGINLDLLEISDEAKAKLEEQKKKTAENEGLIDATGTRIHDKTPDGDKASKAVRATQGGAPTIDLSGQELSIVGTLTGDGGRKLKLKGKGTMGLKGSGAD